MKTFRLPNETHVSRVQLRTRNLARACEFYERVIGFQILKRERSEASLSASGHAPALLVFAEDKSAAPRRDHTTGLYHFAIRYPTRRDLAQAVQRLLTDEYPIPGASDHGMGESIHLNDADGNGVELYFDRPRSEWPMRHGQMHLVTRSLDFVSLLAMADPKSVPSNVSAQTDIGHINLHVADLPAAEKFYHDFLGLNVTARIGRSATFFAAGDYHHHIAANIWAGKARPPRNAVGLMSYRLAVPTLEALGEVKTRAASFGYEVQLTGEVLQVRDPNGHWLELKCERASAAALSKPFASLTARKYRRCRKSMTAQTTRKRLQYCSWSH